MGDTSLTNRSSGPSPLWVRSAEFEPLGSKQWKGSEMASDLEFVEFVVDQIKGAGVISFRKMFGEYAIYCEGKVVLLICDNQVFVKPTEAGKSFIGDVVEAPPYPGAKPSFPSMNRSKTKIG